MSRFLKTIPCKLCLLATCGWVVLSHPTASAQSKKLQTLLRPETLQIHVRWLEKQIGPAKYIHGVRRTYIVSGCKVSLELAPDNTVLNIGLDHLSANCTFDTAPLGLHGPAHLLRFQNLSTLVLWNADETCLAWCGNAVDPVYTLRGSGPHSTGFLELQAAAGVQAPATFIQAVRASVPANKHDELGGGYVGKLISQPRYNALWMKHFGPQPIQSLHFGYGLFRP